MSGEEDKKLLIYPSRIKLFVICGVCLAVTGGGLYLASILLSAELDIFETIFWWSLAGGGTGFFFIGGLLSGIRLINWTPAVIIDQDGITDHASGSGVGFIAWDEIERFDVYWFEEQRLLGIWPKDEAALAERIGSWKARALRINKSLGVAPVNIADVAVSMELENIGEAMAERLGFGPQSTPAPVEDEKN